MNSRFLGIALVVLAVLGLLNLYQAVSSRVAPSMAASTAVHVHNDRGDSKQAPRASSDGVMLDRTFDVSDGGLLDIAIEHSDVEINTGSGDEARIVIHVKARNEDRAREVYEHMNFEVDEDDDRIVVRSRKDRRFRWRDRVNINVDVTIPTDFNLDLTSTHGDVIVDDLNGDVQVTTTHGEVTVGDLLGDLLRLITTHGEVHAGTLSGDNVDIRTTHGDITIERVISAEFDATTTHSDIEIRELEGQSHLSTTHGDVVVAVTGNDGLVIQTTHGDVAVEMSDAVSADIDLRGDRVRVPSGMSFDGTLMKKSATGTVNGGGANITVRTTHGEVVVVNN